MATRTLLRISVFCCICIWVLSGCKNEDPKIAQASIHIQNGLIVDGTGSPGFKGDVVILNDSIIYTGPALSYDIDSANVIDATGKTISPGFIDAHAHGSVETDGSFENFIAMGVTTICLGQDGGAPFDKDIVSFFNRIDTLNKGVNVAYWTGHGSIRRYATDENGNIDFKVMHQLLDDHLANGAFGLSTGLEYIPGIYSDRNELVELAKIVGKHSGIICSHMRNEDDLALNSSLDELIAQGQHCRVNASHLKAVYGNGAERGKEIMAKLDSARQAGIQISADVYPYTASYTGIGIVFPEWAKTEKQYQHALINDKDRLKAYLKNRVQQRNGPQATLFGTAPYAGKSLLEVSQELGKPYESVLAEDIGPRGASAAYFVMNEDLQTVFVNHPQTMICSDGSPTMRHPRGYGTFSRIIQKFVVQEKGMSLESAIHKMTGLTATTFGINKRGFLQRGMKADVVIFNANNIKENASFEDPYQLAEGFEYVIINGQIAKSGENVSRQFYGELLKRNSE